MTAAWPAGLPGPGKDVEVRLGSALAIDPGRFGLRHRRRRMTSPWDTLTGRIVLDDAQRQALATFFAIDLCFGALWFTADWLALAGYPNHQARFVRPPAFDAAGQGMWRCQVELEIRDAGFADDAGLPSPHHDPAVQSGPISPFDGKVYRFYDDFSTYQGWTLEAGGAPTHDAAAGTLTLPAGTRISKPLGFTASPITVFDAFAWVSGSDYSYFSLGLFDDAGNGYEFRIFHTLGVWLFRYDSGVAAQLHYNASTPYGGRVSVPMLRVTDAGVQGIGWREFRYTGGIHDGQLRRYPVSNIAITPLIADTTYTAFTKVRLMATNQPKTVSAVEVVAS